MFAKGYTGMEQDNSLGFSWFYFGLFSWSALHSKVLKIRLSPLSTINIKCINKKPQCVQQTDQTNPGSSFEVNHEASEVNNNSIFVPIGKACKNQWKIQGHV